MVLTVTTFSNGETKISSSESGENIYADTKDDGVKIYPMILDSDGKYITTINTKLNKSGRYVLTKVPAYLVNNNGVETIIESGDKTAYNSVRRSIRTMDESPEYWSSPYNGPVRYYQYVIPQEIIDSSMDRKDSFENISDMFDYDKNADDVYFPITREIIDKVSIGNNIRILLSKYNEAFMDFSRKGVMQFDKIIIVSNGEAYNTRDELLRIDSRGVYNVKDIVTRIENGEVITYYDLLGKEYYDEITTYEDLMREGKLEEAPSMGTNEHIKGLYGVTSTTRF
jgi:hypothetical protein